MKKSWAVILVLGVLFLVSDMILSKRFSAIDLDRSADLEVDRLERAAMLGDMNAHLLLGQMYQAGVKGVAVDNDKALAHYRKAAESGSPEGAYNAAMLLYASGDRAAIPYLWVAYKGGVKETRSILGAYLLKSGSVQEGESLLRVAAQDGDASSMRHLAEGMMSGVVTGSVEDALFWGSVSRRLERDPIAKMTIDSKLQGWLKSASPEVVERADTRSKIWISGYRARAS